MVMRLCIECSKFEGHTPPCPVRYGRWDAYFNFAILSTDERPSKVDFLGVLEIQKKIAKKFPKRFPGELFWILGNSVDSFENEVYSQNRTLAFTECTLFLSLMSTASPPCCRRLNIINRFCMTPKIETPV